MRETGGSTSQPPRLKTASAPGSTPSVRDPNKSPLKPKLVLLPSPASAAAAFWGNLLSSLGLVNFLSLKQCRACVREQNMCQ